MEFNLEEVREHFNEIGLVNAHFVPNERITFTRLPGREPFDVMLDDYVKESERIITSIRVPSAEFAVKALKLVGLLHLRTEDFLLEREQILKNNNSIYTLTISRS